MLFNSFKIAFSMYSKIPMPRSEWNNKNMKYVMCFFPLVGVVIGILMYAWYHVTVRYGAELLLRASGCVIIPLLITGGIHLDGFIDTMDARSSYQPMDRKLEILKDPHVGAFGIISTCMYMVAMLGVWSQVDEETLPIIAFVFVLSRAMSGISIVSFKCAKTSGLAASFADTAHKRTVRTVLIMYVIMTFIVMALCNLLLSVVVLVVSVFMFWYYKHMAYRDFGGITGDLAGWFLQMYELAAAMAVIAAGIVL